MKNIIPLSAITVCLTMLSSDAWGIGRGGGGGGGRPGGGGGARPAPRPAAPAARPAPRPSAPVSRPSAPMSRPSNPGVNRPGPNIGGNGTINPRPNPGGGGLNRPGGLDRPGGIGGLDRPGGLGPGGLDRPGGIGKFDPGKIGKIDGGKLGPDWRPGNGRPGDGGLANIAKENWGNRTNNINHIDRNQINNIGNRTRINNVNVNAFNNNWWGRYPNAWRPGGWGRAAFWGFAGWGAWSAFAGYPATPVYYDYGSNVVYEGDTVYVNGESAGTQEQYAQQAVTIADTGRQAQPTNQKDDWMSLGVFAMVQGNETDSNKYFQLAVNKAGVIRGNFYDALTESQLPVYGQVDQKTQRAAWTVGDKKDVIYEAGAGNLTQDQTTMLVHFGKDRSQQWTLVRIPQPAEGSSQ